MRDLAPDTVVDQRYSIVERIGSGGMADVYLAQDLQLGRKVALKLLYRRFAEDAEFVERFKREASSAAGLQHPNVVAVYDRGEWEGTYYIAMEYLEGRSLKELVTQEAPLEPERASTGLPCACSGERYCAVPMIEPVSVMSEAPARAIPKSVTFARPSLSMMTLWGLRSRWMIPRLWANRAARRTWIVMSIARSGGIAPCSRISCLSVCPLRNSIAM